MPQPSARLGTINRIRSAEASARQELREFHNEFTAAYRMAKVNLETLLRELDVPHPTAEQITAIYAPMAEALRTSHKNMALQISLVHSALNGSDER